MEGIIFDLDGVICRTDQFHFEAWRCVLGKIGIIIGEKENAKIRGVGRMEGLDRLLNDKKDSFTTEEKQRLAKEKNDLYVRFLEGMTKNDLSEEVKTTLNAFRARGFKMAIGSSSRNAKLVLRRIGLENFFDAVSDGNGIRFSKPHPEVFLRAADMLGLSPAQCLVVEDACFGIDAAEAGGFLSAGIGDAANYVKADFHLKKFSDLLFYVDHDRRLIRGVL